MFTCKYHANQTYCYYKRVALCFCVDQFRHAIRLCTYLVLGSTSSQWHANVVIDMRMSAGGGNFNIPIPSPASAAPEDDGLAQFEDNISRSIVEAESSSAWTLMHRYNKATELLDSVLSVSFFCECAACCTCCAMPYHAQVATAYSRSVHVKQTRVSTCAIINCPWYEQEVQS